MFHQSAGIMSCRELACVGNIIVVVVHQQTEYTDTYMYREKWRCGCLCWHVLFFHKGDVKGAPDDVTGLTHPADDSH